MANLLIALGVIIIAYLLGSLNFAVIFAKIFTGKDVRKEGSGNAGTTNVLRTAGFVPGLLTFLFDGLKGYAACFLGRYVFEYLSFQSEAVYLNPMVGAYACMLAVMLGHIFPVFFGFKGGKGIAVSVGTFAVCSPYAIIAGLIVFAAVLLISKIVSISSLFATVTVVGLSIVFMDASAPLLPQIICTVAAGIIVFAKHKDNIIRLKNKTEKKITIRKAKKNG